MEHWQEWLESLNESTVWTAAKYTNNPPTDTSRAKVPNLKGQFRGDERNVTATTNEDKVQLFYEAFFPDKPQQQEDLEDFNYLPPRWKPTIVTNRQIRDAINRMLPYKATAPNTVLNCVLKEAKDLLIPYLGPLFQVTFSLEHYPEEWAQMLTVVLKKPGKPNYEIPGAW